MSRPAKAIDTNFQKMSKEERKQREETEKKLRGENDKIKPFKYLNKRQKAIFKDILKNLNKDILSNLDVYLLNQTAITIERLESIEKEINNASKVTDENGKYFYSKLRFRYYIPHTISFDTLRLLYFFLNRPTDSPQAVFYSKD